MLLFGHSFIQNEHFYRIADIDAIAKTPSSSLVYFSFTQENLDIISHCQLNSVRFALKVQNITEIIYASSLGASYIVVPKELAKTAQNLANNYLFDAKILVRSDEEEDIEEFALLGIDGILFGNGIIKVNA
jgi:hypothetical protein